MSERPAESGNGKAVQIAVIGARLTSIDSTLARLEAKLDTLAEWRNATDARLATGAERFDQHTNSLATHAERIDDLGKRVNVYGGITGVASLLANLKAWWQS